MMDYDAILELASALGCKAKDLLALSPNNDPFYTGVNGRRKAAEWFAGLWETCGFHPGMHLRRIHYILVSSSPAVIRPDGKPYLNTDNDWSYLGQASLAARYERLIPDAALVDRRNPQPIINAVPPSEREPFLWISGRDPGMEINLPTDLSLPNYSLHGFDARQAYLVEVWVEKSTQNDVLVPLAGRMGVNLVPGTGETSEILARQAVERAASDGRPMRVLYISDFDPGGRSMPVALARKIEFWNRSSGLNLDITLDPIVLTPEQCQHYRLPRTPLKETEKRAGRFEDRFGEGATELDALEALFPGELSRIVEREIRRYIDTSLHTRVREVEWRIRRQLDKAHAEIIARHDVQHLTERFAALRSSLLDLMADVRERWTVVADDLHSSAPEVNEDLPSAEAATPPASPLFDSGRDYLTQIDHYRRWQGAL